MKIFIHYPTIMILMVKMINRQFELFTINYDITLRGWRIWFFVEFWVLIRLQFWLTFFKSIRNWKQRFTNLFSCKSFLILGSSCLTYTGYVCIGELQWIIFSICTHIWRLASQQNCNLTMYSNVFILTTTSLIYTLQVAMSWHQTHTIENIVAFLPSKRII